MANSRCLVWASPNLHLSVPETSHVVHQRYHEAKSTELNDSIKHFQSVFRNAPDCHARAMQAAQDYATVKAHLEERVANLKHERESAMREVESLGLRVAIKELERQAKSLEDELEALNGRKNALEQKLAGFNTPAVQVAQPQQGPLIRPVASQ